MNIRRMIGLGIINHLFCGTRFFNIKRKLLLFSRISCGERVKLVGPIHVGNVVDISIGNDIWIGKNFTVHGNGKVRIENNIDIAPDVTILTGGHIISDNPLHRAGEGLIYTVAINNGCWIGARTTILGNTTISSGSVIGACSLVNKNIPPNSVAFGIPAKINREL